MTTKEIKFPPIPTQARLSCISPELLPDRLLEYELDSINRVAYL